jgi:hypothetical protein
MNQTLKASKALREGTLDKIPTIKAIREVSTCGLKDAKELLDRLIDQGEYTVTNWRPLTPKQVRYLKGYGIEVVAYTIPLRMRTQQLLIAAIKDNDRVLAKGLFRAWHDST